MKRKVTYYAWCEGEDEFLKSQELLEDVYESTSYPELIGSFVMSFSDFEQTLDSVIDEYIFNHKIVGKNIILGFSIDQKIRLVRRHFLTYLSYSNDDVSGREEFIKIVKDFFDINTFRNKLIHSDWTTLTKDRYLVNKIIDNSTEGGLDVELIKITEDEIEEMEGRIHLSSEKLFECIEEIYLTR